MMYICTFARKRFFRLSGESVFSAHVQGLSGVTCLVPWLKYPKRYFHCGPFCKMFCGVSLTKVLFSFYNFVILRYIQLSLGNKVAIFLGIVYQFCLSSFLFCGCLIVFVCLSHCR